MRFKRKNIIELESSSSEKDQAHPASDLALESESDSGSDLDSNSIQEIKDGENANNNSEDSEVDLTGDDISIQVPDSSPMRKVKQSTFKARSIDLDSSPPAKVSTRLPNLRDIFSYKEKNLEHKSNKENEENETKETRKLTEISSQNIISVNSRRTGLSSELRTNFTALKNKYPYLSQSTVLSALKTKNSIKHASAYLGTLPKERSNTYFTKNDSRSKARHQESKSGRLASIHSPSRAEKIVLSSSPIKAREISGDKQRKEREKEYEFVKEKDRERARKKAQRENVISSKVQLKNDKKSILERYITDKHHVHTAKPSHGNDSRGIILDSENEESISDDSEDEMPILKRRKTNRSKRNDEEEQAEDSNYKKINKESGSRLRRRKTEVIDLDEELELSDNYKERNLSKKKKRTDKLKKQEVEVMEIDDDIDDDDVPDYQSNEDSGLKLDDRVLKLLNSANIRDIVDIANIKGPIAQILIENRPFETLDDVVNINFDGEVVKKRRANFRSQGERIVDYAADKLISYDAVDSLVKQCYDYSKTITKEIKKWGVDIKGQTVNGEIAITNVDVKESDYIDVESERSDDNHEDRETKFMDLKITGSRGSKIKMLEGDEDDEDFAVRHKKPIYKSALDNSRVNTKIGYFSKQPKLMGKGVQLKDYQQVGVNWLTLLFQKHLSCILADEMGLGKTIQVIGFLAHLKQKGYKGPHMIVVPSSTLENWLREFNKFAPTLDVVPYYGSIEDREELRAVLAEEDYDVIITTYNLVTVGKLDQPFLRSLNFNVIVYDEGHMLKNASSDRYKKLTKLRANFRLLLTGTPLQNNLKELISLLDFILPEIFDPKLEQLALLFDQKATTKTDETKVEGEAINPLLSQQAINKARVMMAPFVLRRTKQQVMKELPTKHTSIEYCNLQPTQRKIYDLELKELNLYRKERDRRKELTEVEMKKLPPMKKKSSNILMVLRKACMHPLLFRYHYTDAMLKVMAKKIMKSPEYYNANEVYIYEDMTVMSDFELTQLCLNFPNELGQFVLKQSSYLDSGKIDKLVEILEKVIVKKEKILVFSLFTQMLDIIERVLSMKNWKFLRLDGQTQVDTRQTIIDKFYDDKTIPVMLLSTKAGGFGINLVCASHVVIYDQSFNPHDDKQAEDRAHRVGQTKEVFVQRLVCKNSIEENILQLAFNKLQLDNSMMNQGQNVEDILLKTVEDMLTAKEDESKIEEEEQAKIENVAETESVFEAPIVLPLEEQVDENDVQVIIDKEGETEVIDETDENGRSLRKKKKSVNYYDGDVIHLGDDGEEKSGDLNSSNKDPEFAINSTVTLASKSDRSLVDEKHPTNSDAEKKLKMIISKHFAGQVKQETGAIEPDIFVNTTMPNPTSDSGPIFTNEVTKDKTSNLVPFKIEDNISRETIFMVKHLMTKAESDVKFIANKLSKIASTATPPKLVKVEEKVKDCEKDGKMTTENCIVQSQNLFVPESMDRKTLSAVQVVKETGDKETKAKIYDPNANTGTEKNGKVEDNSKSINKDAEEKEVENDCKSTEKDEVNDIKPIKKSSEGNEVENNDKSIKKSVEENKAKNEKIELTKIPGEDLIDADGNESIEFHDALDIVAELKNE